jgi:hypothetical protein
MFASWLDRKKGFEESLTEPEKAGTGIEGVAKLYFAITFFSFVYFLLLEGGGISPTTPAFEEMSMNELLYRLFNAAVWEELVSRSVLIGVPLLVLAVFLRWERPYYRFLIGGGMRLNALTIWLIIISSLVFAFAHVGSWDLWKVPQVLVSGMALGYAFVRFGVHASILLHFSINFVTSWVYELWPEDSIAIIILGMMVLLWIFAGAYFFIDYSLRFGRKFVGLGRTPQDEMREARQKMPAGIQAQRGFVCSHCGNISARYENGMLICLRCNEPSNTEVQESEEKIDLEKLI